jgi:hypothetical protein
MSEPSEFRSFREFYPHYLAEHSRPATRRLHFFGLLGVAAVLGSALWTGRWMWLLAIPVVGYGLAWIGHFAFERNRPATFRHPLYSLLGDLAMFRDMVVGRIRW